MIPVLINPIFLSLITREHGGDEVYVALGHPAGGEVAEEAVEALVGLQQVQHAQLPLHMAKGVVDLIVDRFALPVAAPAAPVAAPAIDIG